MRSEEIEKFRTRSGYNLKISILEIRGRES